MPKRSLMNPSTHGAVLPHSTRAYVRHAKSLCMPLEERSALRAMVHAAACRPVVAERDVGRS